MTRILVTGASGFIGRALVNELADKGQTVRAAMRHPADIFPRSVEVVAVSDLTRPVEWRALLKNVETVVHLAGIAHADAAIAEEAYDRVNRLATAELSEAARAMGIRRLILVSSIRAQCGATAPHVVTEADEPHPTDAYGRSKLAAEDAIRKANVPYTILRPVLVYGVGNKGNLARLVRLARSPWPLPLGAFRNRRSLVARPNLLSAVHHAMQSDALAGETCIVADPKPVTLTEMIAALRTGAGRARNLVPVPPALIAWALKTTGRADMWDRLGGELVADPSKLLRAGWQPAVETVSGLAAMAREEQQALGSKTA